MKNLLFIILLFVAGQSMAQTFTVVPASTTMLQFASKPVGYYRIINGVDTTDFSKDTALRVIVYVPSPPVHDTTNICPPPIVCPVCPIIPPERIVLKWYWDPATKTYRFEYDRGNPTNL